MSEKEGAMVYAEALGKIYQIGKAKIEVLKDITFSIPKAKFAVVTGPSGSRKNNTAKHNCRNR